MDKMNLTCLRGAIDFIVEHEGKENLQRDDLGTI